jgi:hypothetical protein
MNLTAKEISVYKCLAYFDVFRHPLTLEEIVDYCETPIALQEAKDVLTSLIKSEKISQKDIYYFLSTSSETIIEERILNEAYAFKKRDKAIEYARLIAKFPYVEGVGISGSFSKGVLNRDGDIDYFIITKPERLWLCRTLLVLYKKTVLLNSRKYFCINYFVSSDNLHIPDRNSFVATEIKTLMPTYNARLFTAFEETNKWARDFLPNKAPFNLDLCSNVINKSLLSTGLEKLFRSSIGNVFDEFCFRITLKRWQKKFPDLSNEDFDLNLRSRKNVSKHHPRGFQKKVLESLEQRMSALNLSY